MHTSNLLQINWSFNWRYLILLSILRQFKLLFAISQYHKITLCKRKSIKCGSKFNWNIITNRFEEATRIYDIECRAVAQASNQKTIQSMNFFFSSSNGKTSKQTVFQFYWTVLKILWGWWFFFSFDVFHFAISSFENKLYDLGIANKFGFDLYSFEIQMEVSFISGCYWKMAKCFIHVNKNVQLTFYSSWITWGIFPLIVTFQWLSI